MSSPYAGNPNNFPATIPVPSDGDKPKAAAWSVPFEGLADRTAYLQEHRFLEVWDSGDIDPGDNPIGAVGSTSFEEFVDTMLAPVAQIIVEDCKVGDVLVCSFTGACETNEGDQGEVRIYLAEDFGGGSETEFALTGARYVVVASASGSERKILTVSGVHNVTIAGDCKVIMQGKIAHAGGFDHVLELLDAFGFQALRIRP